MASVPVNEKDDRIEPRFKQVGGLGGQQRVIARQSPMRDHDTAGAAKNRERAGLDQQLRHDVAAGAADGDTDRQFAYARGRTSQQQVRDVGAGNQQHQCGEPEQQEQGRPGVLASVPLSARAGLNDERPGPKTRQRLVAQALLQSRFDIVEDGTVWSRQRRTRLFDRHTWLEPGEQVHPVRRAGSRRPASGDSPACATLSARTPEA